MDSTCALCGVLLSSENQQKWMGELRAVYTEDDNWAAIKLSGTGTITDFKPVVPIDPQKRYDEANLAWDSTVDVLIHVISLAHVVNPDPHFDPEPFWGFGFHSACWDLLTMLFQPSLRDLFCACLSMRVETSGTLDWGHTYGGAAYRPPSDNPRLDRRNWSEHPLEGFGSNPFDVPAIQAFFHSAVSLEYCEDEIPTMSDDIGMNGDIFKRLPPEILQYILIKLPSTDVVSLRQSSPVFANLGLSETFWASRFRRGHEYHYVFESSLSRPTSWRALYLSLRTLAPTVPGLVNRKRIWNLALQLESLLTQISGVSCQGHVLKSFFEPAGEDDILEWHTASRGVGGPESSFSVGCRSLRTRDAHFATALEVKDLWVSFVQMSSGSFISGLRFVQKDGRVTSLGYIHPDNEVRVCFAHSHRDSPYVISGWHLAIDPFGFKAIAVLTAEGTMSRWVGESENVPKWSLAGPGQSMCSVKAEFDALKLVSLSRNVTPGTQFDRGLLWRNSCLWSPEIPPDHMLLNGTDDGFPFRGYHHYPLPFSTIIFGGSRGENLAQLLEVVVYIFDVNKFTGFEFVYADASKNQAIGDIGPYSDEKRRTHTPSDDFQLSMPIDGPGGERILGVDFQHLRGRICGLRLRTTREREMIFPPPPDVRDDGWTCIQPAGSLIVGFYFTARFPIRGLGLMSIDHEVEIEAI